MKKFLLSIATVFSIGAAQAQIFLNEVYVQPSVNHHEFIELFNAGTTPASSGCYTIITYFNDGTDYGFYVIDLPDVKIAARSYLLASSEGTFNYQNGQAVADVNWNLASNITRYVYTNGSLQVDNTGAPYYDIFTRAAAPGGSKKGPYAIFLYDGSTLVDGLLGASVNAQVPNYILQMGTLNHTSTQGCGSVSINLAALATAGPLVENVMPTAGTDNGYYRVGNGPCPNNKNWEKASSPSEHTPGTANPMANGNNAGGNAGMLAVNADCATATTIALSITGGPASIYPLTVTLYNDLNANGRLDVGEMQLDTDTYANNAGTITLTRPSAVQYFVLIVDAPGMCFDLAIGIECQAGIGLPVSLKSFNARRVNASSVALTWVTSMETNSYGFEVQRKIGSGEWEMAGFVPSAGLNGNSDRDLTYSFSDANSSRGISQYRLRQLDLDGKYAFSEIRSVRGEGQSSTVLVYPNPSNDGKFNIVFDAADAVHDVSVSDMSGRMIRRWNAVTNNNMVIDNIMPGMYTVRVTNRLTGEISVEKIVVNK